MRSDSSAKLQFFDYFCVCVLMFEVKRKVMFHKRIESVKVFAGGVAIGGGAPVRLQSMTNTDTDDVAATVGQCLRLAEAGSELVRITVPTLKQVPKLREIQSELRRQGIGTPVVADVHFSPEVAEACAHFAEKVRINPGNFVDKRVFNYHDYSDTEYASALERMAERAWPLLEICKAHNTLLRIGVNHGSICDRVVSRYGNTPLAMAVSAVEWIDICENYGFGNFLLSMKSSNPKTMIDSTLLLVDMMKKRGTVYPLHVGVTEAGGGMEGRAKSAVGIGALLLCGVGDTIRVSLTEKPEKEIPFAQTLVGVSEKLHSDAYFVDDARTLHLTYETADKYELLAAAGAVCGYEHFSNGIKNLVIENPLLDNSENQIVTDCILQACRIKTDRAEFISCPSCGRTRYDIESVLEAVKKRFSKYAGVKIGVMGCVVNGPGEMADADFGVVGTTNGKLIVYKGKTKMSSPLPIDEALQKMEMLIIENQ